MVVILNTNVPLGKSACKIFDTKERADGYVSKIQKTHGYAPKILQVLTPKTYYAVVKPAYKKEDRR